MRLIKNVLRSSVANHVAVDIAYINLQPLSIWILNLLK